VLGTRQVAFAVALLVAPAMAAGDDLRRHVPLEPGGVFEIDLARGSVEVDSHDEPDVWVDVETWGWGASAFEFELSHDGRTARLVGRGSGWGPLWFGPGGVRVRAHVPARCSLDVRTGGGTIEIQEITGEVRAHTRGGSVEVSEVGGSVDVETSGGSIRAEEIGGDVVARTSGGSVRMDEVAGRVEARTSGGTIELREVAGPVVARTGGGSIRVRFTRHPGGELRTSGGSIEAEIPEGVGLDLEASTSGGRVDVERDLDFDGELQRMRAVGRVNGGGPPLQLHTSGGSVTVRSR
jgi:hypothetical protein